MYRKSYYYFGAVREKKNYGQTENVKLNPVATSAAPANFLDGAAAATAAAVIATPRKRAPRKRQCRTFPSLAKDTAAPRGAPSKPASGAAKDDICWQ